MVHLTTHATLTGDALTRYRGAQLWHFAEEECRGLRTALPQLDWARVGDEFTLPCGNFMCLVKVNASLEPGSTTRHPGTSPRAYHTGPFPRRDFNGCPQINVQRCRVIKRSTESDGLPDEGLVAASWAEILKGMFASDWEQTELGTMRERLAAACASASVDVARLVIFMGAGGNAWAAEAAACANATSVVPKAAMAAASGHSLAALTGSASMPLLLEAKAAMAAATGRSLATLTGSATMPLLLKAAAAMAAASGRLAGCGGGDGGL